MDLYEKVGYSLLGGIAILALLGMVTGILAAGVGGLVGLAVFLGVGVLFVKVLRERVHNREDDYYDREIKR